jgi:PBSX family phage terminase large subunit
MDIKLTEKQMEMLQMAERRVPYPLFVGGYGSGKSYILTISAIRDLFEFKDTRIGIFSPTFDLLKLNLMPRIEELLTSLGISYEINKHDYIIYVGNRQLIFRSLSNPERIVAYEVYRSHVDEIDLIPDMVKAEEVFLRVLGRTRQVNPDQTKHFNQVSSYSTPEGYHFVYKKWVKEQLSGYEYVTAPTSSNPFLDDSYVENLKRSYTEEQQQAYLEGAFVNLTSGNVYKYFERELHHTDRELRETDDVYVSVDFNVGGCCCCVFVVDLGVPTLVHEFTVNDTEEMVEYVAKHLDGYNVTFYPDATGRRATSNAEVSDIQIIQNAGFKIKAKGTNPRQMDRINAVNRLFYNKRLFINTKTCPETAAALEQQIYNRKGIPEKFPGPATIDDRTDAFGYFIAYEYPIRKPKMSLKTVRGF